MINLLLMLIIGLGCSFMARGEQPNVIVILVDDLGREAIGSYGGESYPTPSIDRLAERGIQFEHFYVAPVCHPTRITLMTGRYLSNLGNPEWGSYPQGELERTTLAWGFNESGFATSISGKWHLGKLEDDPRHPHHGPGGRYMTFAEMLAEIDQRVGDLMRFLEAEGLSEKILAFFLMDNGTAETNYIRHEGAELIKEPPVHSIWRGQRIKGGQKTPDGLGDSGSGLCGLARDDRAGNSNGFLNRCIGYPPHLFRFDRKFEPAGRSGRPFLQGVIGGRADFGARMDRFAKKGRGLHPVPSLETA